MRLPLAMALLAAVLSCHIAFVARAHPGTWDGKVIMNENGAELPDLTGVWAARNEPGQSLVLQLYQPPNSPAASPNSTYAVRGGANLNLRGVCTLRPQYDYITRKRRGISVECSSVDESWKSPPLGVVSGNSKEVTFIDNRRWLWHSANPFSDFMPLGRFANVSRPGMSPGVTKVHVVFMNHYDVGYTDFINGVDNTYMHKYFQLAAETAQKMRASHEQFVYTTHPWLMERYLNCPCPSAPCLATSLNNSFEKPLVCPSREEVANFTAAAKRGDIVWNGAPFNIQPENMATELLQAGFDQVRRMDTRFDRKQTKSMSIRDVIYVTQALLPHLKRNGIDGLTIGSNGADYPPQVPKLHRWIDPATTADIIVAYHPYGYGGYGLKDCAESPNGVALCTEFRTDNTGPPSSVAEVQSTLDKVRKEYPGATVESSTFDAFFRDVIPVKDQLPVVSLEVADTWTYGNPSDPLKIAQHRAIQRTWIACLRRGDKQCALSDPTIQNMTFFLLKAPEHTWGTPGISGWGKGGDYDSAVFRKNLSNDAYMRAAASWAEQRMFNELSVQALEHADHPLAADVRKELAVVENVVAPDLADLKDVATSSTLTIGGGWKLAFREDGAIKALQDADGVNWASSSAPLGAFVYQTFNDTEWRPFTFSYLNDHTMQTGFCKPGSNNFTESALWRPLLKRVLVPGTTDDITFAIAVMEMPVKASAYYGAPREIYLNVSSTGQSVHLTFTTIGKLPTMVGEASMVTFQPAPQLQPVGKGSAWRLDKLGQGIDPEAVQDGGNQFTHGVWHGATVATASGSLQIESLDAINFNPMTKDFPIGNPLPASYLETDAKAGTGMKRLAAGSVHGMAVNLHNNLWNTNYPLFYPYFDPQLCSSPLKCRNSNALWRFTLSRQEAVRDEDTDESLII